MAEGLQEGPMASQQFGNTVVDHGSRLFQGIVHGDIHLGPRESRLHSLDIASGATFDAANKQNSPSCLENTRVDLLQQIESWIESHDEKRIYWLRGMAGTGKSTIALTIVSRYAEKGRLGASFFFSRGGGDLGSAKKFVPTIAAQLAEAVPGLHECIDRALESNRHIFDLGVYSQWQKLVLEPLAQLGKDTVMHPIVVVIDALDECDDDNDIALLVKCFEGATTTDNSPLRLFITSRPESLINHAFDDIPRHTHKDFVLHNIEDSIVDQDLTLFYQDRLSKIAQRFHLDATLYSEGTIQILVQKSHRLFIHAATVCRFIQEGRGLAGQRLALLIDRGNASLRSERELDQMYTTVLTHSWSTSAHLEPQESADLKTLFSGIVGSIVVLFDVVNVLELATILDRSVDEVGRILRSFHSVLDVPEEATKPIRLLHPSFRDFLLDRSRCKAEPFSINAEEIHRLLLGNCLRLMKFHLKRNICNLNHPGVRARDVPKATVSDSIPHEIQYACRYWLHHLQRIGFDANVNDQLEKFFTTDFLYWLECLSLLHRLPDSVTMIRLLDMRLSGSTSPAPAASWISKMKLKWQGKTSRPPSLSDIVHDAMRFLLYHGSIIAEAPLQIYCSALVFSPDMSIIRKLYSHLIPTWVTCQNIGRIDWSAHLQTIALRYAGEQIIFSPNGQLIATSSSGYIQVFIAATGTEQAKILVPYEAHHSRVSVAFSPNNLFLVSGTSHGVIQVWDVHTGEQQLAVIWPDLNQDDRLTAVAFSPDGQLIAAAKNWKEVRLWDRSTGQEHCFTSGNSDWLKRIVFCDDSFLTTTGSNKQTRTIRLWHKAPYLVGENRDTHLAAFSSDLRLAAVSRRISSGIQLWDISTSEHMHRLKRPYYLLDSLTFSPNSEILAVTSSANITLLDTSTGTRLYEFEDNSSVNALAFSPNGQLASVSRDNTIRLWSMVQNWKQRSIKDDTIRTYGNAIALSRDGSKVASISGSSQAIIQVCGNMADPMLHVYRVPWKNSPFYNAIKFSDDCLYIAIALPSRGAVLDAGTGHIRWSIPLREYRQFYKEKFPVSLEFSPDSRLIASQTRNMLEVFDVVTGKLKYDFERPPHLREEDRNYASAFSPDSCLLACMMGHEVRILDASTGQVKHCDALRPGSKHTIFLTGAIQFSPNGRLIAVGGAFDAITLFDAVTGRSISTIQILSLKAVVRIMFSPDSRLLLSLCRTEQASLWDVTTGKLLYTIDYAHWKDIIVTFSPDSQRMFWSTRRGNIYLWDLVKCEEHWITWNLPILEVMSVSPCGAYLITERGTLGLPWLRPHPLSHTFAFEDWITNDGNELIYIHHDYRDRVHFVQGNSVFFDNRPGSFLRINTSSDFAVGQDIPKDRHNREGSTSGDG
ncbi:hypothetical protein PFICI_11741 [Pestalotiopsis fici W106-1]|uniref:Mitochondrial division protein 1 n=1 Tax=Pestalotiopsis fici (strain W106-1 / CGMCC3.15140) TaxID=1229662 RepID=W3WR88_PESFW|nr:uncharacterized protein PFICI_11741 [Pestalotiopsis fici W106-1]ETS76354.1 hypothetical protein PFICI_11741 [Pestalotiopsis fici W106-1]